MGIIFTSEQTSIINEAVDWYHNSSEQVFQFAGYAGTGKSVVLSEIVRRIGIAKHRIAPMAYIGQAAIVMRLKGLKNAKTIHSWLFTPEYTPKYDNNKPVMNVYFDRQEMELTFVPKLLKDIDLIIIDEGGSVPYDLKYNIESTGKKILVGGDLSQMPPVIGSPAYLYNGKVRYLTQIMRQAEDSAILYLATRARQGLPIHTGYYGDCLVIEEKDLTRQMILGADILICGKNYTREKYNKKVREEYLGFNTDIPNYGEKVICKKNNWTIESDGINLTNGLIGSVMNQPGVHSFDGKTFTIDFRPDLLNTLFKDIHCDYTYFIASHDQKQYLKNKKYNVGEKFDFAYANTTHSSQGSQYANGIYIEEFISKDIQTNLNYTGITRFSNALIYVKKDRKYY